MKRYPIDQPYTTETTTIYGTITYSTSKAHKLQSKDGPWCWIPKAAIKSTFKAGQQLTIYKWFNPVWLA